MTLRHLFPAVLAIATALTARAAEPRVLLSVPFDNGRVDAKAPGLEVRQLHPRH